MLPLPAPALPAVSHRMKLLILHMVLLLPLPADHNLPYRKLLVPQSFLLPDLIPALPEALPYIPLLLSEDLL